MTFEPPTPRLEWSRPWNTRQLVALAVVGLGVAGALVLRPQRAPAPKTEAATTSRPRLVELGSTSCQSCKATIPTKAEVQRWVQTLQG